MKPLSERDENKTFLQSPTNSAALVGMKPLSERDENSGFLDTATAIALTM